MECLKCQHKNPEDAKFCNKCGAKMELTCPDCAKDNPSGSRFCNQCGKSLVQATSGVPKDLFFDEKLAKVQRYLPEGLTQKILSHKDRIEGERNRAR